MNKQPTVSVIVPVYKAENYLHRCIDSLLAQTFTDFELLLVDDGSPDRSGEISDEYAKKDSRIRVFHKENGGVSSARNLGLDNAGGMWVVFVDSDDKLKPDYLLNLYINSKNVDCVICGHELRNFSDEILKIYNYDISLCEEDKTRIWSYLGKLDVEHYIWNRIYRLSIIRKNNIAFRKLNMGEDTLFNLDYISSSGSISILDYVGYVHYKNSDSLSSGYRSDYVDFYTVYLKRIESLFNLEYPSIREYYLISKMRYYYGYIFNIRSKGSPYGFLGRIRKIRVDVLNNRDCVEFMRDCKLKKRSWRIYQLILSLKSPIIIELFYSIYYFVIRCIK